ncbi:DUF805 domain-containing protein [Parasphingorhabdus sp.]|uniref:DUF805 domain-containing protein n=1 Tax=Parasphingorhabdus sp. TaxID=2709688 RepID=UPI003A939C59
MEWMLMPLRRYADFNGRSRRKEYWMFALLNTIIYVVLYSIMLVFMGPSITEAAMQAQVGMEPVEPSAGMMASVGIVGMILIVYALAVFIPSLAVTVRRFHDQDKSGWFVLLGLVPFVGGLILLVFMCLEGTRGDNRYGPDPKMADNIGETFS